MTRSNSTHFSRLQAICFGFLFFLILIIKLSFLAFGIHVWEICQTLTEIVRSAPVVKYKTTNLTLDGIWRSTWMLSTPPIFHFPYHGLLSNSIRPSFLNSLSSLTPQHLHISHTTVHVAQFKNMTSTKSIPKITHMYTTQLQSSCDICDMYCVCVCACVCVCMCVCACVCACVHVCVCVCVL